ncbi:MAG: Ig-like domain-containing protein [bacterium]
MNRTSHRHTIVSIVASALLVVGCHDGLLNAPAGPLAVVQVTPTLSLSSGGSRQAYDRVDRMVIQFSVGSDVRVQDTVAFNPALSVTKVRVSVPLKASSEALRADVELLRGTDALFRGTGTATLTTNAATPVNITLDPIITGVSCVGTPLQLSAYGQAGVLGGVAIFATGDTVSSVPVTWSASSPTVSVSEDGQLIALQDGSATATCSAAGFSSTRPIQVLAIPRIIQVDPANATVVSGNPLTLTTQFFDVAGNAITTAQPIVWTSTNLNVATVSTTGVVTAVTGGTARVTATSGQATGGSNISTVVTSAQGVTGDVTVAATAITGTSATLIGSAAPNSTSNSEAWFSWGPNVGQFTTAHQPLATGTTNVVVTDVITGLTPGATYSFQLVTQTGSTVKTGGVQSFRTPTLPGVTTLGQDVTYTRGYALQGDADPNGIATFAWFEYGTSPTLATFTQTLKQPVGGGNNPVRIRHVLPALQPATTYYARLVASSIAGTTVGGIVPFTTAAAVQ